MPLTAVPDPVDKAAHLQWLFAMARRDHIAAKKRLKWEAERERQRLNALKTGP
jgi:hypothetical protein